MSAYQSFLLFICMSTSLIRPSQNKKCQMETSTITCKNITLNAIQKSIEIDVLQENVINLNITNSYVNLIQRKNFVNYKNLRYLSICHSQLMFVEENAFLDLLYLEELDLSDNFLRRISTNLFPDNNKIISLMVPNNLIEDLDDFDINRFPHLKKINLSNNILEYLPSNLINKMASSKDFIIAVNKNPFNCSHVKWKQYLTNRPQFCNEFNLGNTEKLKLQPIVAPLSEDSENKTIPKDYCIKHCHFFNCLIWTFSGIWIGIIVGNVCKIKDLIFLKKKRVENKFTQYDYLKFRLDKEVIPTDKDQPEAKY
ncbi:unnamed protein product [Brassicogethes aeneus]|uniref:Uncharacterized protein n=1 Tax=Brassicogethes aeneus TaxID=1431903 RepID=A0A9P0FCC6_BRAAE|nr:unnamed protein product [Brassicogethes aeneus]